MRDQLRTYAQRLRHAPVESGQLLPAAALQPLIGPNGALMWTDQRLGALAARRGQGLAVGLAVKPPARSHTRAGTTANRVTGWLPAVDDVAEKLTARATVVDVVQRLRRPTAPKEDGSMTTAASKPTSDQLAVDDLAGVRGKIITRSDPGYGAARAV